MLLHIGYHKTATTWLQELVFSEPLLGFVQPWDRHEAVRSIALARPFCFDADDVRRRLTSRVAGQDADDRVRVLSHERFSGIPFTGGHDSEIVLGRLHEVFPEARVLVSVREQRAAVWSAYRQYVLDGGPESPRQWLTPPKTGLGMTTRFDADYYCYDRLVAAYCNRFGPERVLVVPYELLVRDPVDYVRRIVEFAGAPAEPSGFDKVGGLPATNVSIGRRGAAVKRLLNLGLIRTWLSPAAAVDGERLNYVVGRAIFRAEQRVNGGRRSASAPEIVWRALDGRYTSSNLALSRLTGLDLEALGYQ